MDRGEIGGDPEKRRRRILGMLAGAIVLLVIALVYATVTDLKYRIIPNRLTFPMLAGGFAIGAIGNGQAGLLSSLTGTGVALAAMIVPFTMSWMGAGDVKLSMVVGALMGPDFVLTSLLFGAIVAGIIALGHIAWQRQLVSTAKYLFLSWLMPTPQVQALKARLPYAPAIAGGCAAALVTTALNTFHWFGVS